MNKNNRCGNCDYFEKAGPVCKRYPPTLIDVDGVELSSCYPEVAPHNWCGEWKLREELKEEDDNKD